MSRPVTLITGASSGIGMELARVFAQNGHALALLARSQPALEALRDELAQKNPKNPAPLIIPCDMTSPDALEQTQAALAAADVQVNILVNNAGYGLTGPAHLLDLSDQLAMIDLNCRALTAFTLGFAKDLFAQKGRLLNVASTAAFQPGPGMAVYYASKSYVLSFTEALAHEWAEQGVSVSALCPGPTMTGFQKRAGWDDKMILPKLATTSARDVAEAGFAGLMRGTRVIIPGWLNKLTAKTAAFIPNAVLLPMVARIQSKRLTKT